MVRIIYILTLTSTIRLHFKLYVITTNSNGVQQIWPFLIIARDLLSPSMSIVVMGL